MNKLIDCNYNDDDIMIRPKTINEYIGQDKVLNNIKVFIKSAKLRNEIMDHTLIYGPPGLGKTTLAMIIANEMNAEIKFTSGPSLLKNGDLIACLTSLKEGDILFIDEIHRIPKQMEELLYSAMEDFVVDIIVGNENNPKSIRINIEPFTLIGATTRIGDLTGPLRDRFGIISKLDYYSINDLSKIIKRTSTVYNCKITDSASYNLARRSRGTPRIANRLFKRVMDYAVVYNNSIINDSITNNALSNLHIDSLGLDEVDINILKVINNSYDGGPVGLKALAQSIGEEVTTIEDVYEPFLLRNGLIKRTSRGRMITSKGIEYIK